MRNINILFAMLLFAFSEGIFAQTESDTLQIQLDEVTRELKELQRQKTRIKMEQLNQQKVESIIINHMLTGGEIESLTDLMLISDVLPPNPPQYYFNSRSDRLDLSRRGGELGILKAELQRQEAEITRQQETLQKRKTEIIKQLKAQQKQQDIVQTKPSLN